MRHRQIPGEIQENGGRGRFSGGALKFGSVSKFGRISPEQLRTVPSSPPAVQVKRNH